MGRDPDDPRVDMKFYVAPDRGIAVATLVFGAVGIRDGSGLSVHSLSVLVPSWNLSSFLVWKDVCLAWLQRTVHILRVGLDKVGPSCRSVIILSVFFLCFSVWCVFVKHSGMTVV